MIELSIIKPLLRKIDKVFFGFEDIEEIEKEPAIVECDNDEEYDAVRSSN
jgi:hypothetical protein